MGRKSHRNFRAGRVRRNDGGATRSPKCSTAAPKVDFLSIGTNDLTQFLFAAIAPIRAWRAYDCLAGDYPFLRRVVKQRAEAGVPFGVREMGGRPLEAMALIGSGIEQLRSLLRPSDRSGHDPVADAGPRPVRVEQLLEKPPASMRKTLSDWPNATRSPRLTGAFVAGKHRLTATAAPSTSGQIQVGAMTENEDFIQTRQSASGSAPRVKAQASLDEIATQREFHSGTGESGNGDWSALQRLPTRSLAKSYATAVGLDRTEIATIFVRRWADKGSTPAVRVFGPPTGSHHAEMAWSSRPSRNHLVCLVMTWLNKPFACHRRYDIAIEATATAPTDEKAAAPAQVAQQQPTQPQVARRSDRNRARVDSGDGSGQTLSRANCGGPDHAVPQNAAAPLLKAGKPEALRVDCRQHQSHTRSEKRSRGFQRQPEAADIMRAGSAGATPPAPSAPGSAERRRVINRCRRPQSGIA